MPPARPVSSSTTAPARCKLLLPHASDVKAEAVATESVLDLVTEAAATSGSDLEEFAWSRAQTRISIFSAQQYVENYLTPPFHAAGYLNLNFIDVSLNSLVLPAEASPSSSSSKPRRHTVPRCLPTHTDPLALPHILVQLSSPSCSLCLIRKLLCPHPSTTLSR